MEAGGPLAYTLLRCHSCDASTLIYIVELARYQLMIVVEGRWWRKVLLVKGQGNLGTTPRGNPFFLTKMAEYE
jgi:hypothetical protein